MGCNEKGRVMIDAWIKAWTDMSQTTLAMPEDVLPAAAPAMAPLVMGTAVMSAAAAGWAGLCMGMPRASLAAWGVLTTKPKTSSHVRKAAPVAKATMRKPATPAKTTRSQPATAVAAATKTSAKSGPRLGDRPAGLDAPRGGQPDDLKRIVGVGPKLESVLSDLGIYHFDQIAAWTKKEAAWVDDYLRFKGRIERDGWITQATALAKEVA